MVDIHTHILPGIDDGSRSIEESLRMLRLAEKNGVEMLAATPHFNQVYGWLNYAGEELSTLFSELKNAAQQAGIRTALVPGMEIRAFDGMIGLLEKGKLLTLNGTQYVLTEFDENEPARWCRKILEKMLAAGFIPVVAHPERYDFVADQPWLVCDWLEMGCAVQITRGSLTGRFGRAAQSAAEYMLEEGWVTCVASDAHRSDTRTPEMISGYEFLTDNFSAELADQLMNINPSRILNGVSL